MFTSYSIYGAPRPETGGPGLAHFALLRPPYFWQLACFCLPLHATLPCVDRMAVPFDLLVPYYIILLEKSAIFFADSRPGMCYKAD